MPWRLRVLRVTDVLASVTPFQSGWRSPERQVPPSEAGHFTPTAVHASSPTAGASCYTKVISDVILLSLAHVTHPNIHIIATGQD